MISPVRQTDLPDLPLFRRGKVRDTYDLGDVLLMVATDRISAFDVVLPTPIPRKGIYLTQLSRFWFEQTRGLVPNHFVTADLNDFPPELRGHGPALAGRAMLVRKAERIDVECVVRGYLAGSAWADYRSSGTVGGEPLPAGLRQGDRLPAPLFTPAIKRDDEHDVPVSATELADFVGDGLARRLEEASRDLFDVASELALRRGIILADTKFEFGFIDGQLAVIDELVTPDSSRLWDAAEYQPGRDQPSFDKQFVRDWLETIGWDKRPPGPELPSEVVAGTSARYAEAFRRLTGWSLTLGETDEVVAGALPGADSPIGPVPDRRRWLAEVDVLPKPGVNDPEGEAVAGALHSLGHAAVEQVRAGRHFKLVVAAADAESARATVASMCEQLLANPVIQTYRIAVRPAGAEAMTGGERR